jgi:hypothetical protein
MKTTIQVSAVQKFQTRYYPECPQARLFCALLHQESLTRRNIETIKALGFTVEAVPASVPESTKL